MNAAQQEDFRNGFISALMGMPSDPRRADCGAYTEGRADGNHAMSSKGCLAIRNKLDEIVKATLSLRTSEDFGAKS
jgi:hypothetical protein